MSIKLTNKLSLPLFRARSLERASSRVHSRFLFAVLSELPVSRYDRYRDLGSFPEPLQIGKYKISSLPTACSFPRRVFPSRGNTIRQDYLEDICEFDVRSFRGAFIYSKKPEAEEEGKKRRESRRRRERGTRLRLAGQTELESGKHLYRRDPARGQGTRDGVGTSGVRW